MSQGVVIRCCLPKTAWPPTCQKKADLKRADAINNLSVGAEYELLNRINVFGRLNNLLNKAYATEAGYPVEGLHFMAGISCRF